MTILDDIKTAMEQAKPIRYYATADYVSRGTAFMCKGDGFFPPFILFHPDDFEAQRAELARYCRLVPFSEWRPTAEDVARSIDAMEITPPDEPPPLFGLWGGRKPKE